MSFANLYAQPSPSPESGVEGVISITPVRGGPTRIGVSNSRPFANTEFVVKSDKSEVASFRTDDQGHFRIVLPPGRYAVSQNAKPRIGFYGPFEVDVVAGQMTKVDWHCDSGMR